MSSVVSPSSVPAVRVRSINGRPANPKGEFVVYWMIANRRVRSNFSLDRAVELMDNGQFEPSIQILRELHERYPHHLGPLHELALAYRLSKKPAQAVDLLLPYKAALGPQQLAALGSALDEAGRKSDSLDLLRWGLSKYPTSGLLYSELGVTTSRGGDEKQALQLFQRGMEAEPSWPSNYLQATRSYANTGQRGLALIHGEIFRVLEPSSKRSADIATLMAQMCHDAVRIERQGTGENIHISLAPGKDPGLAGAFELMFGLPLVAAHKEGLSLKTLHKARVAFLGAWFRPGSPIAPELRDTPLFQWQRELGDAGHFEAYDYWLFAPAFPEEAERWTGAHAAEMKAMAGYLVRHPLFTPAPAAPTALLEGR